MHQLAELEVMFSIRELRLVVCELQGRVTTLEGEVQGLRLAVNYEPGERQAKS